MNTISLIHGIICLGVYQGAAVANDPANNAGPAENLAFKVIELGLGGLVIYLVTKPLLSHVISYQNNQSAEIAKLTTLLATSISAIETSRGTSDADIKRLLSQIAGDIAKIAKRSSRAKNHPDAQE